MLRIALAVAVLLPVTAGAAEIRFDDALACDKLSTHEALDRMIEAGDKEGAGRLYDLATSSAFCGFLKVGTPIKIGRESGSFACVEAASSRSGCRWVRKRLVWR